MPNINKKIDDYIDKSAEFAKPILLHIRQLVHKACPDVEEVVKWGMPFFDYKGPICNMAAFKQHCAFGFWKASLMTDPDGILAETKEEAMGHMGRITSVKDLPSDKILIKYIKEAVRLNEEGVKVVKKKPTSAEKKELTVPAELKTALNKNKEAKSNFESGSYSFRKEYIDWIEEAKTEATKTKRILTAVEWISEGKSRNWKYERK